MEITRTLARFVVDHTASKVPQKVRHEAARSFLNWVGCAVGGSRHETVERALAALKEFSGPPEATVLGPRRARRYHAGRADERHHVAHLRFRRYAPEDGDPSERSGRVGDPRARGASAGRGRSVPARVHPRRRSRVPHRQFGLSRALRRRLAHHRNRRRVRRRAAAAGKLLGSTEQQMAWALGIAATQSSGLREMFGTMCKPFHPGNAARNGLLAALLAQQDFTSSNQGIEAKRGFAHVLSTTFKPEEITERLGETWEDRAQHLQALCLRHRHPPRDRRLHSAAERAQIDPQDVEAVELRVHPLVLELTGKKTPQVGLEGKFSVYHSRRGRDPPRRGRRSRIQRRSGARSAGDCRPRSRERDRG